MFCRLYYKLLAHKTSIKLLRAKSYFHNTGEEPLKPLTLGLLLERTAQKYGDRLAVISSEQDKRLTFSQILQQADRLAAGLVRIGCQYGDRVGIWAPNLSEWYIANMACARAGVVMVAINPAYQPRELEYCINKVGIKGIICGHKFKRQDYYEILKTVAPELSDCDPGKLKSRNLPSLKSVITITDDYLKGTYNYNEVLDLADEQGINLIRKYQDDIKIDDPCNIQFTSGTTGQPKAGVVSHFGMINNGFLVGKRNELDRKHHKICVQVPLFHAFGLVITISAALNHGATLVLPTLGYDPHKSLDAITKESCTMIHGTPTMYVDLVKVQKERNESLSAEIAVSGGASCSPHLFREMLNVLGVKKVKSVYGLSETTAVVFQSMPDDDEYKSTSTVGYIHDHVEAKVVDSEGKIVPFGTPGELYLRGYFNMLGYWQDEENTKKTIGADRWLRTGDQFVLEENGYGRIVGRLKEMIIRGGENIYPREIEDFLNTHPNILETHVIGLPHERLGEEVCACVRLNEGSTLTLEEIKDFCRGNISHFKIPTVLEIVDSFPRTASGKIQKFKLLEKVQNDRLRK